MAKKYPADTMTDQEITDLSVHGSDGEWWRATGICGGCGEPRCHPGKACTEPVCRMCPAREVPCPAEMQRRQEAD